MKIEDKFKRWSPFRVRVIRQSCCRWLKVMRKKNLCCLPVDTKARQICQESITVLSFNILQNWFANANFFLCQFCIFRNVQDWKRVYPPEFRILKSYRSIAFQNLFASPSENLYATNQTPVTEDSCIYSSFLGSCF